MIPALILREVRRGYAGGGAGLVVAFFLLAVILFPLAIGPDHELLARIGGGVIWAAALLAALLPVERLVAPDMDSGVTDQLALRGTSLSLVAACKIVGHWLAFAPPIALGSVIGAGLLNLSGETLALVLTGLAIGTPGLAALAVATGALVAGLRGAGAVAGLMMLPLAIPILIFGAGMLSGGAGAIQLLAATSLAITAAAPFVAGAAMRFGRG